jgi:hypothetical protein
LASRRIHQRTIERAFAQAAADHKHIAHMHVFPCCSPSRMRRAGWRGSGWRKPPTGGQRLLARAMNEATTLSPHGSSLGEPAPRRAAAPPIGSQNPRAGLAASGQTFAPRCHSGTQEGRRCDFLTARTLGSPPPQNRTDGLRTSQARHSMVGPSRAARTSQ